jgi:hypothetical protein
LESSKFALRGGGLFRVQQQMRTEWFVVFRSRGAWWVDNEGTEFGPFSSREVAGQEALVIARSMGEKTRRAQVYVPDASGKHRLIWEGA